MDGQTGWQSFLASVRDLYDAVRGPSGLAAGAVGHLVASPSTASAR
jgi:hypothetical protein